MSFSVTLYKFLPLLDVLDTELEGGVAAIVVLDNRVADVEGIPGLDIIKVIRHVEGNSRDLVERLLLVDEVQFHVDSPGAHLAPVTTVRDILGQENRVVVARAEGLELLKEPEEFGGYLAELQLGVDVGHGS